MTQPQAFYNEHDPKAAAWLRELVAQGHIAPGIVDERSISDIAPDELAGFAQCHFFAGIGVWPLALRAAGWADDRPVWTGSCPCQPFSAAGKGEGFHDPRHLWPDWYWLIQQRRPAVILGEQVASKDAMVWLDHVSADLEAEGYAFGAADLCAAGAGLEGFEESVWGERLSRAIHLCPDPVVAGALGAFADFAARNLGGEHGGAHIRQRAYLVGLADIALGGFGEFGDALVARHGGHSDGRRDPHRGMADRIDDGQRQYRDGVGRETGTGQAGSGEREWVRPDPADGFSTRRVAHDLSGRCGQTRRNFTTTGDDGPVGDNTSFGVVHCEQSRLEGHGGHVDDGHEPGWLDAQPNRSASPAGCAGDPYASNRRRGDADWLLSRDAKWRPVEPGTFPLAHAAPARVGRLRGYGNALDFQTALLWVETVKSYLDDAVGGRLAA